MTHVDELIWCLFTHSRVCNLSGESLTVAPKGAKGEPGGVGLPGLPGIDGSRGSAGPAGQLTALHLSQFVLLVYRCSFVLSVVSYYIIPSLPAIMSGTYESIFRKFTRQSVARCEYIRIHLLKCLGIETSMSSYMNRATMHCVPLLAMLRSLLLFKARYVSTRSGVQQQNVLWGGVEARVGGTTRTFAQGATKPCAATGSNSSGVFRTHPMLRVGSAVGRWTCDWQVPVAGLIAAGPLSRI